MIQSFRGVNWKIFCLFDRLIAAIFTKNEYWGPISVYKAMKKDSKTGFRT